MELKTRSGKPIKRGAITVTPEAQALLVRLPFWGFVWNRPVSVVIEENGRRERLEIHDQTRAAVLTMASAGIVVSAAVILAGLLRR